MAITALFKPKISSLEELFLDQLKDLYDAETRIVSALEKMSDSASGGDLKSAFLEHLQQTKKHQQRLETIFRGMGKEPQGNKCKGVRGIIEEAEELLARMDNPNTADAGMIAAAQRVEHYEIAGYGTARTFAETLGQQDAARLLQETLEEEKQTDARLTRIAESHKNIEA